MSSGPALCAIFVFAFHRNRLVAEQDSFQDISFLKVFFLHTVFSGKCVEGPVLSP